MSDLFGHYRAGLTGFGPESSTQLSQPSGLLSPRAPEASGGLLGSYGQNVGKAFNEIRKPLYPMPNPQPWIWNAPPATAIQIVKELQKKYPDYMRSRVDPQLAKDYSGWDAAMVGAGYGTQDIWGSVKRVLNGAGVMGTALAGGSDLSDVFARRLAEERAAQLERDLQMRKIQTTFPNATGLGELLPWSLFGPTEIRR